jgi:hypothetical protein
MCSQHARSMASSSMYARSGIASPPLVAERSRRYTQVQPETPRRTVRLSPMTVTVAALVAVIAFPGTAAASPADLVSRTKVWVEDTVGVELPDRQVMPLDAASCTAGGAGSFGCVGAAYRDRIELHPGVWRTLGIVEATGRDGWAEGETLLHELLHTERDDATPVELAEGIVDAVAKDLYMPWTRAMRLTHWNWNPSQSSYPAELAAVRKASALATGKPWKSRAARLWRRDLWRADAATRVAVYEAAWR